MSKAGNRPLFLSLGPVLAAEAEAVACWLFANKDSKHCFSLCLRESGGGGVRVVAILS